MSLPRTSSRTPLREPLLPLYSPTEKPQPLLIIQLAAVLHPRKSRQRTTLVALLSLILLSAYVFLVHYPDVDASLRVTRWRSDSKPSPSQLSLALQSIQNSHLVAVQATPKREQIQLTGAQELAAISSFLASLAQNQISPFVDPSKPIDPQLVLDFDTRGPRASEEVQVMVEDVWSRNPVFLYSKFHSPISREVKAILRGMNLNPSPTIIDVDTRDDAEVLVPVLARLVSSDELPILIVGGKVVGSMDNIRELNSNGLLRQMITQSGAVIDGTKERKRKH